MYIALNPPITNTIDLPQRWSGQPGNLLSGRLRGRGDQKDGDSRSGPLRGRETSQEQDPRSDRVRGEVIRRMETLWSGPLRGRETSQELDNYACFRADTGVCPYDHFCHQFPGCMDTSPAYVHAVDDPSFVLAGLPTERGS